MLRAVAYGRYSSERQKATSIEDQHALCRDAAPRFQCEIVGQYSDEEISGATDQRPGYVALMAAAKARQFEAILVESQDRLWRDQGEMHHALKRLRFWGIKVYSVTASADLTEKTGNLLASVTGWKDEVFLEDLREKTRRGMLGQIRRGLAAGGRAYGDRSEPVFDDARQIIGYRRVIDPAQAAGVLRIFTDYDRGLSPKTIAHQLNEESVPPPHSRRGQRTRGWTWTTINGSPKKGLGILNNPLYIGQVVWNRSRKVRDPDTGKRIMRLRPPEEWITVEVPALRIVPQDLWDRVQETPRWAARHHATRAPAGAETEVPVQRASGLRRVWICLHDRLGRVLWLCRPSESRPQHLRQQPAGTSGAARAGSYAPPLRGSLLASGCRLPHSQS